MDSNTPNYRPISNLAADNAALAAGMELPPPLPDIVKGNEFMDDLNVVEPPQLIKGVLHQGSKLIIGGGSKGRKTWAFMDLAMCISEGIPWWGWETEQGRVLYLNFELQPFAMQKRMKMLRDHYTFQSEHDVSGHQFDVWNLRGHAAAIEDLRPRIQDSLANYSLVVFDPLYKMLGGRNENDAGDMAGLMNELEAIAVQQNVCVVIGAHYRKGGVGDGGKNYDRISGSGCLSRDPDAIFSIVDLDDQEDEDGNLHECCTIDPVLRNFPPCPPFGLYWNCPVFKHGEWINIEKVKGKGAASKRFFVEDIKGKLKKRGWMTYKETYEAIMEILGCKDRKAKDLIAEALECNLLVKSAIEVDDRGRPKYSQI